MIPVVIGPAALGVASVPPLDFHTTNVIFREVELPRGRVAAPALRRPEQQPDALAGEPCELALSSSPSATRATPPPLPDVRRSELARPSDRSQRCCRGTLNPRPQARRKHMAMKTLWKPCDLVLNDSKEFN